MVFERTKRNKEIDRKDTKGVEMINKLEDNMSNFSNSYVYGSNIVPLIEKINELVDKVNLITTIQNPRELAFKPKFKIGDPVWYIDTTAGEDPNSWINYLTIDNDYELAEYGDSINAFKTRKEVEDALDRIVAAMKGDD